ncbi:hypothetical protein DYU11_09625 [Fibrisoma montanum]|uniref:2TM domain-containing protein n=1 Tax=Fibrisoma montanum TaxID=2305895 RepID=A0A418MFK3_9BACT|nr:2TM domain-containing protein [Fibrisoma montanum]RIV25545.1 hypothetical protein DYU11_09625 [Fibrisoma montanum]
MEPESQPPSDRDPHLWKQAQARVGFKQHLRSYVAVNILVWAVYLVLTFGVDRRIGIFPWPLFMTIGWGFGLIAHYVRVYRTNDGHDAVEREYQRLQNQGR